MVCGSKGRLLSQVNHPSHPWGFSSSDQGGLFPFPKGLEGHCDLMGYVWSQRAQAVTLTMACSQNHAVLHYVRTLNSRVCPFSEIEQGI